MAPGRRRARLPVQPRQRTDLLGLGPTALAVLAGGVLLQQFWTKLQPQIAVSAVAILLCVLAAVMCLQAYSRWRGNEIAMRHRRKLPPTRALFTLSVGIFATALILAVLTVLATYRGS